MERFRPSIDWGNELAASALWIFNAWALSAVCVLLVAVLVIRYSTFGRRFWRITGGYFTGTASVVVWGTLSVLLLSVAIASITVGGSRAFLHALRAHVSERSLQTLTPPTHPVKARP